MAILKVIFKWFSATFTVAQKRLCFPLRFPSRRCHRIFFFFWPINKVDGRLTFFVIRLATFATNSFYYQCRLVSQSAVIHFALFSFLA